MRVLVTGAEGFVASHLLPLLAVQGADIVGTALRGGRTPDAAVPLRPLDITNAQALESLVRHVAPTHIVHLAAVSSVRVSFDDPRATEDVNVRGTENLLRAAARLSPPPRVLLIGSGDEYGPNDGTPLPELPVASLHPVSPYGKSKKAVEELVEANAAYRAMTIRTRSFPHIGPRQAGTFFIPEVATQIVRIERALRPPVLHVGNLTAVRDFLDVRDVVRAYLLLLERGTVGHVYNVCSGNALPIRDLLERLLAFTTIRVRIEQDPSKVRPVDIPVLVGDHTKLTAATGWQPEIPLPTTLREILEYHRGQPTA